MLKRGLAIVSMYLKHVVFMSCMFIQNKIRRHRREI